MTQKVRVGILGASGYGGSGLIERLERHPHVELAALASRQFEGQPLATCWPQFAGLFEHTFQDHESVVEACEVLFYATPHGATAPLVKLAIDAGKNVIDLSADFRLTQNEYETWYGQTHPHPELLPLARYGLTELHREELPGTQLVANPGCNASAASLALAPLAANGLLGENVIAHVATGVSGAGRAPSLPFHFTEVTENVKPYKVAGTHRHTAEIEATLGRAKASGKRLETHRRTAGPVVSFNPHLVPMTRGILATCYTRPEKNLLDSERLLGIYREYYRGDPLIIVQDELPQTKAVYGSDRTILSVRYDARSQIVVAFAALDNLGKGAAGQAVQNFNVVNDFEETLGLQLEGVWP
ncbi:MAG: N-acetyl-gamma-glutamyl-phosphate reductase [Trueperaceae bacterium]|nr:MAG: N-acetyl-gamma-glutamyl-phosphate reductase [Trueperaceae bacterium]